MNERKEKIINTTPALKVVFKRNLTSSEHELVISPYSYFFKRFLDLFIAIIALIILHPLLIILYFITKYTSKGPAFYIQKRIGLFGKEFYIFKFRPMKIDSERNQPLLTKENDQRITSWGRLMRKYYIDELPQLLNVIKGDMSIVGPRPERLYFINKIKEKNGDFESLLQVKPGITSLGQIRFGYAHSVDQMLQRLKYEQLYLKKVSLD